MEKAYRKALIAGNWKMNKLVSEVPAFGRELLENIHIGRGTEVALCVPFPLLPAMECAMTGTPVLVGAQDVSAHAAGAYTGEVSAPMLEDMDVACCIIGHSERRAYHGETDGDVNAKLKALLSAGILPVVCVGESLQIRDEGTALNFVGKQVCGALADITPEQMSRVVIAYEPIWAIGTGRTASAEQAQEVCAHIRAVISSLFGEEIARGIRVLYGGSMNAKNAAELLSMKDIDGGLIGGASLKPLDFCAIVGAAKDE